MPEMDGITLLRQVRNLHPQLPFIMLTGNDSKEIAIEALNAGADFYQNKGEDLEIQYLTCHIKLLSLSRKPVLKLLSREKIGFLKSSVTRQEDF